MYYLRKKKINAKSQKAVSQQDKEEEKNVAEESGNGCGGGIIESNRVQHYQEPKLGYGESL